MITYNEALELFLNHAKVCVGTETVPTLYAEGRVLAEDVVSSIDVPAWDNSQMDGYAVRTADLLNATPETPVDLPVSQRIPAGSAGDALQAGSGSAPAKAEAPVQAEQAAQPASAPADDANAFAEAELEELLPEELPADDKK